MNIDVCKILISYTNLMENVMINNIKIPLLNQQWYLLLRYLLTTVQYHLDNMWLWKIQLQENYSVNFYTHWNSNLRLLSAGFVPLNQSINLSELALFCGPVYRIGRVIQKSINRSKKLFTIGFYNITRLWCLRQQMIV